MLAAQRQFFVFFEREEKPGAEHKRTMNVKYFKKTFCTDDYIPHHMKQRPTKWKEYQEAHEEEKNSIFDSVITVKETLHAFFGSK